jgi:hypothetical protein
MEGFGFTTLQVYLLTMPSGVIHAFFAIGRYLILSQERNTTAGSNITKHLFGREAFKRPLLIDGRLQSGRVNLFQVL